MEALCWLACFAFVVLLVPTLASAMAEDRWRHRWVRGSSRAATLDVVGQGAFRGAPIHARVPVVLRDRAPGWVRFVAFTCWFVGQAALLWGLVGGLSLLIVLTLGGGEISRDAMPVLALMSAWALLNAWGATLVWRAGSALLRGERDHADRTTARAAKFVAVCNVPAALTFAWYQIDDQRGLSSMAGALCCVALVMHGRVVRATFLDHREEFALR